MYGSERIRLENKNLSGIFRAKMLTSTINQSLVGDKFRHSSVCTKKNYHSIHLIFITITFAIYYHPSKLVASWWRWYMHLSPKFVSHFRRRLTTLKREA